MRIQQFLHKHKYIFKSNPLIGIYEYDFILSGIKEKNYKPFEGLDLGDWMTGEVKPQPSLTIDQLKKYTLTNGFGYVKD